MYEYEYFNGEYYEVFDIIETNLDNKTVTVNITKLGKLVIDTFPLLEDDDGYYFEYGLYCDKIRIDDFNFMEVN